MNLDTWLSMLPSLDISAALPPIEEENEEEEMYPSLRLTTVLEAKRGPGTIEYITTRVKPHSKKWKDVPVRRARRGDPLYDKDLEISKLNSEVETLRAMNIELQTQIMLLDKRIEEFASNVSKDEFMETKQTIVDIMTDMISGKKKSIEQIRINWENRLLELQKVIEEKTLLIDDTKNSSIKLIRECEQDIQQAQQIISAFESRA